MSQVALKEITLPPKTIPANIESEQLLLGSIIVNNYVINAVADFLLPEHFYEPIHQKLFKTIINVFAKGLSISIVTLTASLQHDNQFNAVGGREYLNKLIAAAAVIVNAYDYAKIIHDLAIKRELINLGEDIVNNTYSATISESASQLLESAEAGLFKIANEGISDKFFEHMATPVSLSLETINKAMKNRHTTTGITTGFDDLDSKLFGFHNSDLVIIAARPSMGKTAFALNLALNACKHFVYKNSQENKEDPNEAQGSVGFFSLEMSAEQLATRVISMHAEVDASRIRSGNIDTTQYESIRKSAESLSQMPLFIDDSGALTISAIRTRARRLKRKNNLSILFIDYLQLINSSTKKENRVLEISEITQSLKALAKELNIPIIALSQLSRAVETREDKKPMLSDLRESGAIEQDADIVMFIYREEYYLSRKEPQHGSQEHLDWEKKVHTSHSVADIIIAKHRNGQIGKVSLKYDSALTRFGNIEQYTPAQQYAAYRA